MIRSFNGKEPKVAASAFISEAAYIIGDVEIGENSSVWPGAVIRGDLGKIKIGKNTAVEDNCVIHSGSPKSCTGDIIIGDEVQVGHGAVINCSRIGNNVLIGMNSTLIHEAEVGNSCVIGAGCLVTQGMKIPDGSVVLGVPGAITGKVSPKHAFWIAEAPRKYAELAQLYKAQGM